LLLDGGDNATILYCGDTLLEAEEDGNYSIPDALAQAGKLSIEIRKDSAVITRRSLFVSDDFPATIRTTFKGDPFGNLTVPAREQSFISGATVSAESPPCDVVFLPEVKDHFRLIFIGRVPGQIAVVAAGERPVGWNPVWAIAMHRTGTVHYCGHGIQDSTPMLGRVPDLRQLRQWKEVLWHRRKRITPPSHEGLKHLWLLYQEEAARL
jgi:hypothetical protein